jgi:hypothetical protein
MKAQSGVWDEGQSAAKNHAFPPPPAAACALALRIFCAVEGLCSAHIRKTRCEAYDRGAAALAELTANGRHMMMGLARSKSSSQKNCWLFVLALATVNVDDVRVETLSISTSSLVCSS